MQERRKRNLPNSYYSISLEDHILGDRLNPGLKSYADYVRAEKLRKENEFSKKLKKIARL